MCLIGQRLVGAVGDLIDILHGLEPSLGPLGGEPAPLEGGITNRNFRVRLGEREYVVRLHGKDTDLLGISREAERLANSAAAELGIAPEVAAGFDGGLVTRYVPCAAFGEGDAAADAERLAVALRRFHESGVVLPVSFDVPGLLDEYAAIARGRGAVVGAEYEQARDLAGRIAGALPARPAAPCHNDLLPGNMIRAGDGAIMIVDWEYAGMGHPCFDLGNLSVNNGFGEDEDERLLRAYHGGPPSPAQRATLALMRVMSDIREAAWGVMQSTVSDLDFDFAGYAASHFRRLRSALEGGALEGWLATVAPGGAQAA